MKRRNTKRHDTEWLRAYGSETRVEWVKKQPCVVTGNIRGVVNAHIRNGGMGRKADARWIVPMSWDLHELLHKHGKETFEKIYGVDLDAAAQATESAWRRQCQSEASA